MARMLGDAFVVISPDTRNFRASADRQIKAALAGLKYSVPLGVDAEASISAIRRLQQRIRQLGLADFLDVNVPVGKLVAQVQLIKRLLNQAHVADALEVNLDQASLARQLAVLRKTANSISAEVPVKFDVGDIGPLPKLAPRIIPVKFDVSDIGPLPKLLPLSASISGLAQTMTGITRLTDEVKKASDQLAIMSGSAMRAGMAVADLSRMGADLRNLDSSLKDTVAITAELAAADQVLAAGAALQTDMLTREAAAIKLNALAFRELNPEVVAATGSRGGGLLGLAAAMGAAGAAFGTGMAGVGRWGGALSATIPILGIAIRSVAFWHIALDLVIEALIAVGLAAVTITPALLVMANVGQDIATHFQAVHTVTESLGQSIGPLTGGFDKLAHAMAPQVIEAFGGAMNAITGKTGLFGQAVTRVVPLINDWIAKIDLWMNAQDNLGKFITAGIGYLSQFASIIGNVVSALGQLLTKDPGIAHYLLDIVNGAALLLKAFSSLPAPVVVAVLALHGIYVWGSVLAPLLLRLAGYVIGLAADFLLLAANPFTWVAGAVIALGLLAYQSTQATSGAKAFVAAIDQRIALDNATTAILDIAAAVGQLTTQIQSTSGPVNAMKQWNLQSETLSGGFQRLSFNLRATGSAFGKAFGDIPQMLSSWPALGRTAADFGHAIADIFSSSSGASIMAKNNIALYDAEITKLIAQQGTLFRVAGTLISQGYTLAQSFALEDLAGVKAADSFALASQKVKNLITGYQDMSVQGGILLNSVNAITFASLQQQSKIADLNSGWTTFISTVTGGLDSFSKFQLQVSTINSALTGITPAAAKGGTALGGLSDASLKANNAFVQGVTDANALINALTLQASASGLASRGTDMLTAATKDTVAQLIPMAGNSKSAQAALIALAQQGGAPAGISFQQLGKWVGTASGSMGSAAKSGGPADQLNKIMGILATASDNLTTDVKNLSIALGTDLTQAESAAIILARGGVKPFDDFAKAVATTGVNSDTTRKAAIKLGDEFLALSNNNVPAAKKQFEAFAIGGLGLSKTQADNLWNDIIQHGIPALNSAGSAADNLHQNHLAPLGAGVDTVAGKVANMSKYLLAVPKNINTQITAHATGTGQVIATGSIPGLPNQPPAILGFRAAGGKITGGIPGKDSVLGMLMPGEVVVPTDMVNQGAVDHLRGKLPGFSGGGVVGSIGDVQAPARFEAKNSSDFEKRAEVKFMQDVIKKFKADVAAAAASGSGGNIVKYAESFLGKIPYVWGGTSLSSAGADCSGFTSSVYGHFGISAPRTSEGQGAWVKRTPPTPGGLAFYHSPPGGPDPGHVAIVAPGGKVVSQGGGMGPRIEGLHFLPLLWTGVPPGGFGALGSLGSAGNLSSNASVAAEERFAASLFPGHGWSQGLMPALIALWNQESGWSPWAVNRGSGAYGIPQALPAVWDHPYALGDAASQIRWGENYIASTYGNPAAAWGHEVTHNWYRKGGAVGLAAGGVPSAGRGVVPHDPMAATAKQIRAVAAMRAKLAAYQAHEGEDYLGLRRAFLRGPAKYKSKAVMRDIARLYKQQGAEQVAYRHLAGAGLTSANLGALGSAARMVGETAGSRAMTGLPGGHPGWAAGLRHWTSLLAGSGSAKLPAALTGIAALFAASRGHGTFTESAGPGAEWQYGTTGLTGRLVPQSMDRGGWLSPGMNLVHNGLGRPEPVGAAAATTIQLEVSGSGSGTFDAFLLKWIKNTVRVRGAGSVQKAFGGVGIKLPQGEEVT